MPPPSPDNPPPPSAKALQRLAKRHATSLPWLQAVGIPLTAICLGLVADRALLGGVIVTKFGVPAILSAALCIPVGILIALWMDLRTQACERLTREHRCPRCLYPLTLPGEPIDDESICPECGLEVPLTAYYAAFPQARWRLRPAEPITPAPARSGAPPILDR